MENYGLIPTEEESKILSGSAMVVKGKRKSKKNRKLLKILLISTLSILLFSAYRNFREIININLLSDDKKDTSDTNFNNDNNHQEDSDVTPPQKQDGEMKSDGFEIIKQTYSFTDVKNQTCFELNLEENSITLPKSSEIYKKYGKDAPIVLIVHSSSLESYSNGISYSKNDSFYSSNNNVMEIGEQICTCLNNNFINAIHIDSVFNNGTLCGSSDEYEKSLNEILKQYPSISYVIDISRSILINDDLTMSKPIIITNEKESAQIGITVGTSSESDFWHKNLIFAKDLTSLSSDLIYDITLSPFELSQNIEQATIRVDIGAFSNTFEEASLCAYEFAMLICSYLNQNG